MGLTSSSTGLGAVDSSPEFHRAPGDRVVALAGNPNVGKSTVFNQLTGLNQHTGNWPGKTVASARGRATYQNHDYLLVDLPGTYSLMAHSPEEEVARDFLCFGGADAAVVVCDATCLERNMNLVLQTIELTSRVVVCVNLMDEAQKKGIAPNLKLLSKRLGVAVVGVTARSGEGLPELMAAVERAALRPEEERIPVRYPPAVEQALEELCPVLAPLVGENIKPRWLALRLLEGNRSVLALVREHMGFDPLQSPALSQALESAQASLASQGLEGIPFWDALVDALVQQAETVCRGAVDYRKPDPNSFDRRLDRVVTGRWTAGPVMLLLLALVLWLTITAANVPSALLSQAFAQVEVWLSQGLRAIGTPELLHGLLIDGVWRVLSWVVAVMLPPMAIFFPLFTLLEDFGYLPRMAFNLDHSFKRCGACGKQSLTMAMGLGCNAAGIVGCRIIDSPRERLIAILTNNLVPCNGRFPTLIALITIFFAAGGLFQSLSSALLLTLVMLLGVAATFGLSKFLSSTVLKGVPSSFTLELPPYRKPQIGKVLVRSLLDRTLKVLGRAVLVAAPAGLLIWVMANVQVSGASLLSHCAGFLDPLGRLMGMDGVILLAFILGFPANEIVLPIILMAYMASGTLVDQSDLAQLHLLLTANGWTWTTALCVMLFSLFHWPCSTTCITIWKETGSLKWTGLAMALPTALGVLVCMLVHLLTVVF